MRFAETAEVVAYGCDISDVALELARTQLSTSRFSLCDGDHLPFGDNQFEYVTNLGSLEHFLSPEHGARDMARVVKADGVVCVLLPNKYRLYEILHVMRTGYESPQNQDLERFAAVNVNGVPKIVLFSSTGWFVGRGIVLGFSPSRTPRESAGR